MNTITMAHGAGGKASRDLIEQVFVTTFANHQLAALEDQARFDLAAFTTRGDRLAMTTDSYVIEPLFFRGGNIGSLAVNGTVNDLAVGGARPLYLTCGMILEEGLSMQVLRNVVQAMKTAADNAGVAIVTGDTKVVPRGAADGLFINTTGVGVIPEGIDISVANAKHGDKVLINGSVGDHGAAVVDARGELALELNISSDCQPLHGLVEAMLKACPHLHCLRDATRGGVATVLNEFASSSNVSIHLQEAALPVHQEVRGVCELLGLDPLYLANEGKLLAVVPPDHADAVLAAMRNHPMGQDGAIIGTVDSETPGRVILHTSFGGNRLIDMLSGDQLPRIC